MYSSKRYNIQSNIKHNKLNPPKNPFTAQKHFVEQNVLYFLNLRIFKLIWFKSTFLTYFKHLYYHKHKQFEWQISLRYLHTFCSIVFSFRIHIYDFFNIYLKNYKYQIICHYNHNKADNAIYIETFVHKCIFNILICFKNVVYNYIVLNIEDCVMIKNFLRQTQLLSLNLDFIMFIENIHTSVFRLLKSFIIMLQFILLHFICSLFSLYTEWI